MSAARPEAHALMVWLERRTEAVVGSVWFRQAEQRIDPALMVAGVLTEAEVIELERPIVADVMDIAPKTWRGRLRYRLARMTRPFRVRVHWLRARWHIRRQSKR